MCPRAIVSFVCLMTKSKKQKSKTQKAKSQKQKRRALYDEGVCVHSCLVHHPRHGKACSRISHHDTEEHTINWQHLVIRSTLLTR